MRKNRKPLLLAAALTTLVGAPALAADPAPKTAGPAGYTQRDAEVMKRHLAAMEKSTQSKTKLTTSHYRPIVPVERQLSEGVVKVRAMIDRIVDGAVEYHIGTTPEALRRVTKKRPPHRAIFTAGTEALAIGKVGDVVTLHLRRDAKGYAFVTNITR